MLLSTSLSMCSTVFITKKYLFLNGNNTYKKAQ